MASHLDRINQVEDVIKQMITSMSPEANAYGEELAKIFGITIPKNETPTEDDPKVLWEKLERASRALEWIAHACENPMRVAWGSKRGLEAIKYRAEKEAERAKFL